MADPHPLAGAALSAVTATAISAVTVPRVTIRFCTQCKWNLRAAYFAQELLQTFGAALGEVALVPSTGGVFVINLFRSRGASEEGGKAGSVEVEETVIWDRKAEGGFPETKELKNRVRNVIEPGRSLGHTDRALKKGRGAEDVNMGQGEEDGKLDVDPTGSDCARSGDVAAGELDEGKVSCKTMGLRGGRCEDCS